MGKQWELLLLSMCLVDMLFLGRTVDEGLREDESTFHLEVRGEVLFVLSTFQGNDLLTRLSLQIIDTVKSLEFNVRFQWP